MNPYSFMQLCAVCWCWRLYWWKLRVYRLSLPPLALQCLHSGEDHLTLKHHQYATSLWPKRARVSQTATPVRIHVNDWSCLCRPDIIRLHGAIMAHVKSHWRNVVEHLPGLWHEVGGDPPKSPSYYLLNVYSTYTQLRPSAIVKYTLLIWTRIEL